jgi:hypothetical protein
MANVAIYAEQQQKIITGAGILPTVPSPPTTLPNDPAWVDATDILEGQFAINITDGIWFYRANDIIIPLPGAINGIFIRYADVAAMIADQGNQLDKNILFVTDASGDSNVNSGYAYYEYLGTTVGNITDYRLISSQESLIVKQSIGYACSDETTSLEVGTAVATFRMPYGFVLTEVRASVTTAPTGANLQVDINEGGISILSTVISIDAGEKTSVTAVTPPVISDANLADDAEITVDIDQIGSTIAGTGLKIYLIGYQV